MRDPTEYCGNRKKRHFKIVAAVDIDPIACSTYRRNHPSTFLIQDDIRNVNPVTIRDKALRDKSLDLLVVCAPCQPFSNQNRHKSESDNRKYLILESVRFAEVLQPRLIMFENVPGLVSGRFNDVLGKLSKSLIKLGYVLGEPARINAADYGVPQRRYRCLMLVSLGNKPPFLPTAITPEGARITVASAIRDLSPLSAGESDDNDPLHFSRNHNPIALKRLACIPKNGGSRFSLPESLELDCHKGNNGYPDVYGRMKWADVAPTLTTGCTDVTRGRFAHPEDDRAITLREAARLQTFPDNYRFAGSARHIAAQIGNAVPMKLIEFIAPVLRQSLRFSQINKERI